MRRTADMFASAPACWAGVTVALLAVVSVVALAAVWTLAAAGATRAWVATAAALLPAVLLLTWRGCLHLRKPPTGGIGALADALDHLERDPAPGLAILHSADPELVRLQRGIIGLLGRLREREAALRDVQERWHTQPADTDRVARDRDTLLAAMSHDLRTPLTAILGMTEILSEQLSGPLNEHQLGQLRIIERSGRQMLAMIGEVLDLARLDAGRLALEPRAILVEAVCRASLEEVEEAARDKGLRLSLSVPADVGQVRGDPARLRQILVKLLDNAIAYAPTGGRVGLEVRRAEPGGRVRIGVWDEAVELGEADRAGWRQATPGTGREDRAGSAAAENGGAGAYEAGHLTGEAPHQQNGHPNERPRHLGLGLALVEGLVRLHGGTLGVESTPGRGSPRCTLELPGLAGGLPQPPLWPPTLVAQEQAMAQTDSQPPLGARVLLAEDNEPNAATLTDYLTGNGLRVERARNGREAVRMARATAPDIVLMDIQMPGMDGIEAIRALRADPGCGHIPIVALTALAMPGDQERCLAAGADDYVTKPVYLKGLVRTLHKHLAAVPRDERVS